MGGAPHEGLTRRRADVGKLAGFFGWAAEAAEEAGSEVRSSLRTLACGAAGGSSLDP